MFTLGILWLRSREKAARAAGEGYGEHDDNDAGLRAMVGEADMSGDPAAPCRSCWRCCRWCW